MGLEFSNEKKQNLHFYYESSALIDYQDALDLYGVAGEAGGLPLFLAGKLRVSVAYEGTTAGVSLSLSSPAYFIINGHLKKFEGKKLHWNMHAAHDEHHATQSQAKLSALKAAAEEMETTVASLESQTTKLQTRAFDLEFRPASVKMPDGGASGAAKSAASAASVAKIAGLIAVAAVATGVSEAVHEGLRARYGAIHPSNPPDEGEAEGEGEGEGEGGPGDGGAHE